MYIQALDVINITTMISGHANQSRLIYLPHGSDEHQLVMSKEDSFALDNKLLLVNSSAFFWNLMILGIEPLA